jgi:curli production assembly/transport component CsgG/holdfast attachment protein HfaB
MPEAAEGIATLSRFPVTSNNTPYSQCLTELARQDGDNLPVVAVGNVIDKTGQLDSASQGYVLTQGASEMVISAFYKSGKVHLVERFDLRVANQGFLFRKNGLVGETLQPGKVRGADFVVSGALTELNYNIMSAGAGLWIAGVGGGARVAVMNVALDLRLVDARSLDILYVASLQKQIVGQEVDANVFRFFDMNLVELDAGQIRNEPLQLGVRSVVEMAVHQILTDFLGLPTADHCRPEQGGTTTFVSAKEAPNLKEDIS